MKKVLLISLIVVLVLGSVALLANAGVFGNGGHNLISMVAKPKCATIQGGTIRTEAGDTIVNGQDKWGYNYQAHEFNGNYCDSYFNAEWCQAYAGYKLLMKWNDAWLSNTDCNGDGLLDKHPGSGSYIGSGAWVTNHITSVYVGDDGQDCTWDYSTKIVAAPRQCSEDGNCYAKDGTLIGRQIWGEFAITQEVMNDPCGGYTGVLYKSGAVGLGQFKP